MREGAGTNHHVRLKLLDAVALEWSGMVAVFNSLQPSSESQLMCSAITCVAGVNSTMINGPSSSTLPPGENVRPSWCLSNGRYSDVSIFLNATYQYNL
jgi:hypothetical protein